MSIKNERDGRAIPFKGSEESPQEFRKFLSKALIFQKVDGSKQGSRFQNNFFYKFVSEMISISLCSQVNFFAIYYFSIFF